MKILRIFFVVLDNLFDYQLFVENSHENGRRTNRRTNIVYPFYLHEGTDLVGVMG